MLAVVGVLTVEAQGKGPWWEIPGKVRLQQLLSVSRKHNIYLQAVDMLVNRASLNWEMLHICALLDALEVECLKH